VDVSRATVATARRRVGRCACGGVVGPTGECAVCRARRLDRQRAPAPVATHTRSPVNERFGHDFSRLSIHRDGLAPDEPLRIERSFELDPSLFVRPLAAPAEKEREACETFPGGSTDCEINEATGTPTGKVKSKVDETNPCTRPCVEKHEQVHVRQLRKLCPELRDCYLAADQGKRPHTDCVRMAIDNAARECEAYRVSVPCVEERLKTAKACQSAENKSYGKRKLESEKCFRDRYCGTAKK
jgi:hypothetical protein